jgi:S-adenosylmethionine:tRNA ribosyltransferase-isomerase
LKTNDFDYYLPPELIAQVPVEPRDSSRLFILDRHNNRTQHSIFRRIGDFLHPGDLVITNETKVIAARLFARKVPTGGKVELLLLHRIDALTWETLVGGKGLVAGRSLQIENGPAAVVQTILPGARRLVKFAEPIESYLKEAGHVPLPPYIHVPLADPERYQTVYARQAGSAAAPTAGLHFTQELIDQLGDQGIQFAHVTLHVGLDTFAPVSEDDPRYHRIHTEWCQVTAKTVEAVRQARRDGGRIIAVGTTSVRSIESAARQADADQLILPYEGPTDLFILPGYEFRLVDALITNFHLPKSTLLMLVSALAGRERILAAYEEAILLKYRFYSFGDAMLIV